MYTLGPTWGGVQGAKANIPFRVALHPRYFTSAYHFNQVWHGGCRWVRSADYVDRGDEGRKRLGEAVSRLECSVEDLEASRAQAWPSRTSQAWACSRTAASQPNKYTKSTFITSQFRPDIDQVRCHRPNRIRG